jgi:hypothetical protein
MARELPGEQNVERRTFCCHASCCHSYSYIPDPGTRGRIDGFCVIGRREVKSYLPLFVLFL